MERSWAWQRALASAIRTLDLGADPAAALAAVLRAAEADARGIEAVLLCRDDGGWAVLARAPDGPDVARPDEIELASRVVTEGASRHEVALTGTGEAAAAPERLGFPVFAGARVVGALLLGTVTGRVTPDDVVLVEALSSVLSSWLTTQERLAERRELEQVRTDFVARVSHELRTPLAIISGYAGTLAAHDETIPREQRHQLLDRIITAAVRLEHLVDDLLSLASVGTGSGQPQPVTVPVLDIIDVVVRDHGGGDRVTVTCPPDLKVRTDPALARQTLGPVVENALQHGEAVAIAVAPGPDGVRIEVADDGPGVPDELGERVFERFFRGVDRTPGMGLGLSIARSLAATLGGRILLLPNEPGARFLLDLPDLPD